MNNKGILYAHGGMEQCGVNYWETYDPLVNKTIVRSLLSISSIHRFPSRSTESLIYFTQAELDVYVFMHIPLGMGVDRNRG